MTETTTNKFSQSWQDDIKQIPKTAMVRHRCHGPLGKDVKLSYSCCLTTARTS